MALSALPQLISLVKELVGFLNKQFGDNWPKYLADSGEAFKKLNEAKTPEEKVEAAKALQSLIGRWGP